MKIRDEWVEQMAGLLRLWAPLPDDYPESSIMRDARLLVKGIAPVIISDAIGEVIRIMDLGEVNANYLRRKMGVAGGTEAE